MADSTLVISRPAPLDDDADSDGPIPANLLAGPRNVKPYISKRGEQYMNKEQLEHFGIDSETPAGGSLAKLTRQIYQTNVSMHELWGALIRELPSLERKDRIAWFNAKKFLCLPTKLTWMKNCRACKFLAEIKRVLAQGGAVGKRLDFLTQELHREANTLGSKSVDPDVSRAAMEIKLLIEQMREQIQNIE